MDKKTIFKIVVIMALILFALTIFPFLTQWLGGLISWIISFGKLGVVTLFTCIAITFLMLINKW